MALIFEKWFAPALEVDSLENLPQLRALQICQSLYLTHGESLSHNIYHIIIRPISNIVWKIQ